MEKRPKNRDDFIARIQRLVEQEAPSCCTCAFFSESEELCTKIQPAARPPARVIAYGCEAWLLDPPF